MTKATQGELLQQNAIHAAMMCMSMFDEFVMNCTTVYSNERLSEKAEAISEQMYALYNLLSGHENEQN